MSGRATKKRSGPSGPQWRHKMVTVEGHPLDAAHLDALAVDGWEVVSILPHFEAATGLVCAPVRMVVVLKRLEMVSAERGL